ncbi:hypothetical protein RFI_28496 [Reticulomyxa filosa]|uniref:Uncharacterized protein n=1 Tax=Reticulomyxa filosa TaxID=46433 RepID=X6M5L2_RETFI|nr:hypothetical protein RFI_28496 [Reticulomyxa filosa]|eukprot:ETO08891.1 hypothetical protein RFI_28496 [Reticulomyxa filosa]
MTIKNVMVDTIAVHFEGAILQMQNVNIRHIATWKNHDTMVNATILIMTMVMRNCVFYDNVGGIHIIGGKNVTLFNVSVIQHIDFDNNDDDEWDIFANGQVLRVLFEKFQNYHK